MSYIKVELKIGDKVCYQPDHYKENGMWENGIIKEIPDHTEHSVRVVYNCARDWDNYMSYTSALTSIDDLTLGWKHAPHVKGQNHDNLYGIT